ncbi:MAG: hypothetical protein D6679_07250 [Candidatus Hydrogenedentota bacterium]|nr:MAG: hypothetical protein D6679_07250 [Candidatus Hydrogenedentota bacterium]
MRARNPFLEVSRMGLRRLLGLACRNPLSRHFGSFARDFWHYRAVTDFPSATYQQGVLPLALAYANRLFGKEYYRNDRIRKLAVGGVRRWVEIQHSDGSFDEWYPQEHSHVATAFTSYAVSEAVRILGISEEAVIRALERAGAWLGRKIDRDVANHTAGAVAALWNIAELTGSETVRKAYNRNVEAMGDLQSEEGWFPENGSFDIGYLSVSLHYLAKAYDRSGDERIRRMVERGAEFLDFFVAPDGAVPSEIGNRNTQYLMPAGILLAARYSEAARRLRRRFLEGLEAGRVVGPTEADDRYFTFFFLPNFMQAAVLYSENPPVGVEEEEKTGGGLYGVRDFPRARALVSRVQSRTLFLNYGKGGVFRLYRGPKLVGRDAGYFARLEDGRLLTTALLAESEEVRKITATEFLIETPFKFVDDTVPAERFLVPFRFFSATAGRVPGVMPRFNEWVKERYIRARKPGPLRLKRCITLLDSGGIRVEDEVTVESGVKAELIRATSTSAMHVPSSRYAATEDFLFEEEPVESGKSVRVIE